MKIENFTPNVGIKSITVVDGTLTIEMSDTSAEEIVVHAERLEGKILHLAITWFNSTLSLLKIIVAPGTQQVRITHKSHTLRTSVWDIIENPA